MLRARVRYSLQKKKQKQSGDATDETPLSKCIINVSSLLALKGVTGTVTYAASKAGLLGLTRSVAVEASETLRGVMVRSNAIVPGYIETPMIAGE
jgi:NAD(P)-dependent dehydrogenase (short-subunit alcohol dehydrogenase family)